MSRSKAANREGSIRRHPDGKRWVVEISLGYGADGKRRRTRRLATTHDEAIKLRTKLLAQQEQGILTEQKVNTIHTYGLWWAREVKPDLIRPTTATDYEYRLRRYVFPYLGAVRMVDLTPQHVQRWLRRLHQEGKSASTVNGARRVLFGMCKHAERQGVIPRNPVAATDPIRKDGHKSQVREPWTLEETHRVLHAAPEDPALDCFLHLMLHLGLRPGEALGMRWQDIDQLRGTISVTGTLKEARAMLPDGRGVVRHLRNKPKTKHSARTILLSPALIAALERQRARQERQRATAGSGWRQADGEDYVITTSVGTPVSLSNLRKRYMGLLNQIGVRYIRLHDMRHTVARVALEADIPIEQVSQTIGHTRVDTTKQQYAGWVNRYTENFVNIMSSVLPAPPSPVPDTVEELEKYWGAQAPAESQGN